MSGCRLRWGWGLGNRRRRWLVMLHLYLWTRVRERSVFALSWPSPVYSAQDRSPWDGAAHIGDGSSFPSSIFRKGSHRQTQRCVSVAVLNPVRLTMRIYHHTQAMVNLFSSFFIPICVPSFSLSTWRFPCHSLSVVIPCSSRAGTSSLTSLPVAPLICLHKSCSQVSPP